MIATIEIGWHLALTVVICAFCVTGAVASRSKWQAFADSPELVKKTNDSSDGPGS